jgi:hypothetical protein
MRCSRCRGHVVHDKRADVPRNFGEYFCMNCGERFWIELPPAAAPPSSSEKCSQNPSDQSEPLRVKLGHN